MRTLTEACEEIVERVERGLDTVVEGDGEAVRSLLAAAAARLESGHGVVTVAGPAGGLSLSGLIAQLSGRGNLNDHDDSVLELGVRRLKEAAVPGQRTVMVLDVTGGVQRSAFRFLRQVGRQMPDLIYVMAGFDGMEALLAETGMDGLQTRLTGATVAAPDQAAASVAEEAVDAGEILPAVPAVVIPREWQDLRAAPLSARQSAGKTRTRWMWTASAVGVAALVTVGAWLGARTDAGTLQPVQVYEAASMPAKRGALSIASIPAETGLPSLAASAPPSVAGAVPAPSPAVLPRADLATMSVPTMATAGVAVASAAPGEEGTSEAVPLAGLPRDALLPIAGRNHAAARQSRVAAPDERRRILSPRPQRLATLPLPDSEEWGRERWSPPDAGAAREARTYRDDPDESATPPVRYRRYAPPDEGWRGERAVAPTGGPYIGTYEPGAYGTRVFRYDP